jgi:predicted nucleic acid-binding Zn ribbon protein
MSLEPTGYCWGCGRTIDPGLLFCPKPRKCKEQYEKRQNAGVMKSKRDGYGAAGSTH